ncbi:MAG: sporulation transcriptional regulator SpoIIID [Agathobaculum sp.]|uniref:sporulation transcriptional regulator SpoIIID n=1 Tax=Agathobaculum sp. TaxID=2048138 RepID=UPI003D8F3713
MKGLPEERAIRLAQYMVEKRATVRQTAARFGISKSTVHKDITTRLQKLNAVLYDRVQEVLRTNKNERHIRGGMATREKYRAQSEHGRVRPEAHKEKPAARTQRETGK